MNFETSFSVVGVKRRTRKFEASRVKGLRWGYIGVILG